MIRLISGIVLGAIATLASLYYAPDGWLSIEFANIKSKTKMVTCPTIGEIHYNVNDDDVDIVKHFKKWTKITEPKAGERLRKWVKAESVVNEFLGFGSTWCTYESTDTDSSGSPRKVMIVTYGAESDHKLFIKDSNWTTTNASTDAINENWKFECTAGISMCKFPVE